MKLRVLGCSGAEFPNMRPPAFLIDETLLMDAGTIGAVLSEDEQWKIREIILTHAHLDHIRGIPFLADNIIVKNMDHNVRILSTRSVLGVLKNNLLNDMVWPDFTVIPSKERAVLRLEEIEEGVEFTINGYRVCAYPVNHSVPAVGYRVLDERGCRLIYTGDTGPTTALWAETANKVDAAIIEVSMPNTMREMAILTGHLTAELLGLEMKKMKRVPERILITHPKPQYLQTIRDEIKALGRGNIEMLADGEVIEI